MQITRAFKFKDLCGRGEGIESSKSNGIVEKKKDNTLEATWNANTAKVYRKKLAWYSTSPNSHDILNSALLSKSRRIASG